MKLFDVRALHLVETAAPTLTAAQQAARDTAWNVAVRANPLLFDGPVVACTGLRRADDGVATLSWARVKYRNFAVGRSDGMQTLPSVFVAVVLPTEDGGVLVGRTSSMSASPGRFQLPGGSVEPPEGTCGLNAESCAQNAGRELTEEVGIVLSLNDLTLWALIQAEHGNVGILYCAPKLPETLIRQRFELLVEDESAAGRVSEFCDIAFPGSPADLADIDGSVADHVGPVLERWSTRRARRRAAES